MSLFCRFSSLNNMVSYSFAQTIAVFSKSSFPFIKSPSVESSRENSTWVFENLRSWGNNCVNCLVKRHLLDFPCIKVNHIDWFLTDILSKKTLRHYFWEQKSQFTMCVYAQITRFFDFMSPKSNLIFCLSLHRFEHLL